MNNFSQFLKLNTKCTLKQMTNKYNYHRPFNAQNIMRFRNYLMNEDWQDVYVQM